MSDLVDGLRNMGLNVCSEAADEIERLRERLAEAERLLRGARRKIRDLDSITVSQFIDEGVGASGFGLLIGIDAFLAGEKP